MDDLGSEWQCQGATLSDKTARKEFGLTQDEIVEPIRTGKLHYRVASMHGNPWLRLLRREVEALGGAADQTHASESYAEHSTLSAA